MRLQNRRGALKYLFGGSLAMWIASVVYPLLAYLRPPLEREIVVTSVNAGKLADIKENSGRIIRFGTKPVLLVRQTGGELRAFSATCSHLDCTVQYRGDMGIIWCACHNGKYDLSGRNIAGPPPRPLEELNVIVKNEEVFVIKKT